MSDLYAHFHTKRSGEQERNLVALGRYLVVNRQSIDAAGTLGFVDDGASALSPGPGAASTAEHALPALSHGPRAGVAALPGETWSAYWERAFGIAPGNPMLSWLHAPPWSKTDPTAMGAGLRIAYALDYGVPHDHVEIAMGQAWSDYDASGFLWERLDIAPVDDEGRPLRSDRNQPKWIGAVDLDRMRKAVAVDADNLVATLLANGMATRDEIEGCTAEEIAGLAVRLGRLPRSYVGFLRIAGRRAARLADRNELRIFADQLDEVNRMARERILETGEADDDPVPRDVVFIGDRHGEHPWFVLGGSRADSPVFHFNSDTGKVSRAGITVWAWVESLVRDMRPDIRIALSESEAAAVERIKAIADEMNAAQRPPDRPHKGADAAVWTMIVGGGLLAAATIGYQLWRYWTG